MEFGKVDVLITYSETSSVVPLYNESISSSTSTDSRSELQQKLKLKVRIYSQVQEDGGNPITQKETSPKIEGAIVIAEGARKY